MRKGLYLLVPFGVLLLVAAGMAGKQAIAQRAKSAGRPQMKFVPGPPEPAGAMPAAGVGGVFNVRISPDLKLDAASTSSYKNIADKLSRFSAIPNSRLNYYSAFENTLNAQITGWSGYILDIRDVPGGQLVDVQVAPDFGLPIIFYAKYIEHFLVTPDGTITYSDSSDPEGLAGQPPRGAAIL